MISTPQPCLWFDDAAEQAAEFYASTIPNSRVVNVTRYPKAGHEVHGKEPGSVMTADVEINGTTFMLLNGGPQFTFSEAVSFMLVCDTQDEVDRLWDALVEGGGEHGPCGWLKDRFGLSWQIVPAGFNEMMETADTDARERAMGAMMRMGKLDLAELQRAAAGD